MKKLLKWHGVLLALLALLLSQVLSSQPELVEQYYSRGLYVAIRKVYDWFSFLFVLPGIVISILLVVVLPVVLYLLRPTPRRGFFRLICNILGWILFLFYFLWAYNYQRIPYTKQVGLQLVDIDSSLLFTESQRVIAEVNGLRSSTRWQTDSTISNKELNRLLSSEMSEALSRKGYPADFSVDVAVWRWRGILLRFSTAGIYIPHALQGNIDGGLHPIQRPFTMSHEMTHAFGITHEGVANFLAYVACSHSKNQFVRYSAELAYLKYLLRDVRRSSLQEYDRLYSQLSDRVIMDMVEIRDEMKKYPDLIPKMRDAVYDQYLKSHGIKSGLQSYNLLVRMVISDRLAFH